MEEGSCQRDLLLGLDCQGPYHRDRHGQHDEPVNDIWYAQPLGDHAEIDAFPAADPFIPSERYGRALEDGDESIGGAGREHDESDDEKREGELLHLGREDTEVKKEESALREDD